MGLFGKKKEEKTAQGKSKQGTERPPEKQMQEEQQQAEKQPQGKQGKAEQKGTPGQQEMKIYIQGAGETIVAKSILNGTSKLKWLFRQETEHGNGWVAFGDRDSQEYVDDAKNMAIVDFNTLANIEPAVADVFYMPVGSNLEFRSDKTVLEWKLPESGLRTVLFSSGMGDGIFSGYWGLDAEGEAACLTVPFMNPEYF